MFLQNNRYRVSELLLSECYHSVMEFQLSWTAVANPINHSFFVKLLNQPVNRSPGYTRWLSYSPYRCISRFRVLCLCCSAIRSLPSIAAISTSRSHPSGSIIATFSTIVFIFRRADSSILSGMGRRRFFSSSASFSRSLCSLPDILSLLFPAFPQIFPKNRFWEKYSVFGEFLGNFWETPDCWNPWFYCIFSILLISPKFCFPDFRISRNTLT